MAAGGISLRRSPRILLQYSHAGAAAIAILIFSAVGSAMDALRFALPKLGVYAATAIAIRGAPFTSAGDRMAALVSGELLAGACIELALAWLLARWVYRAGPLAALRAWRVKPAGRSACSNV